MAEPVREETDEGCGKPALDRIARVAARALHVPLALIALLDDQHRVRVGTASASGGGEVDRVEVGDDLTVTGKLLLPANDNQRRSPLTVTASSAEPGASQHHLSYPLCTSDEKPVGVL